MPIRRFKTRLHLVNRRPLPTPILLHCPIPNEPSPISGQLTLISPDPPRSTRSRRLHLVIPNEPNPISGHRRPIRTFPPQHPTNTLEVSPGTH